MFPGFVNIYKDKDNYVHLYFFSGIDEQNDPVYKDIDLSKGNFTYTMTTYGNAIDYKFDNKSIIRIKCELVPVKSGEKIERKILTLKNE